MGNKEMVFKKISENEGLTASELANLSGLSVENVKVYIQRLKKSSKIQVKTKKGREDVYITREKGFMGSSVVAKDYKEKLIFMNNLFKDNIDHIMKSKSMVEYITKNEEIFKEIESLVK